MKEASFQELKYETTEKNPKKKKEEKNLKAEIDKVEKQRRSTKPETWQLEILIRQKCFKQD